MENKIKKPILYISSFVLIMFITVSCSEKKEKTLAGKILNDKNLIEVRQRAEELIRSGFNAGDGYGEVWIRDLNTFIELSCEVNDPEIIKQNLLVFFQFQGEDGNIIDGFIPIEKVVDVGYDYIYSPLAPMYAGHKNTVETDQESSLVQAVWKYIKATGDSSILKIEISGTTVLERMEEALQFLLHHRYSMEYGLLWGATTVDWGDVQPEHPWGVVIDENTHYAVDIYDNAMLLIAIENFIDLLTEKDPGIDRWSKIKEMIFGNVRSHLWDEKRNKFIPHLYLKDSPFPEEFDENEIHYHGGTAVAIEAQLLSIDEIGKVYKQMARNTELSGAMSIGLTVYPPYPDGYFLNKGMIPYGYQNGGDWTWFGGRMIKQLVKNGYSYEAYQELKPMIMRVIENDGFFEWYTIDGKPTGSGNFRGSAGVLATSIDSLLEWAKNNT